MGKLEICYVRNCLEINFQFEDISEISIGGWEICSFTLELFIGDFKLGRMEVRLFTVGII